MKRFVKSGIRYEAEKNNQLANFNFLPYHGTLDTFGLRAADVFSKKRGKILLSYVKDA